jgi:hypothetical protein
MTIYNMNIGGQLYNVVSINEIVPKEISL